jgi:adenylyltransferase/sulfurtransferase
LLAAFFSMTHDHPLEETTTLIAARINGLANDLPKPLILDCRTAEEHAIARIEGALLIPMQEIAERLSEIEAWRDKPIIVHCHHGVRSLRVTHFLRDKGFSQVQSMKGGIDAWSVEVDPSVPRY